MAWAAPKPANFTVKDTSGSASVKNASGTKALNAGDTVSAGETATTGASDTLDLQIVNGKKTLARIHADSSTSLTLEEVTVDAAGRVPIVKVSVKLNSGSISVNSSLASSIVVGAGGRTITANGSFSAKSDGTVYCFTGTVSVATAGGRSFTLIAGQSYDPAAAAVLAHNLPSPIIDANDGQTATPPPSTVQVVSPTQPPPPTPPTPPAGN